jgi:YVTN family beta-propeller protein
VAVNPAGTRLYVTNFFLEDNTVSVIDTTTNTVLTTVAVGRDPLGVAVNPAGTRVYVANQTDDGFGDVSVIDTASNTVVATVGVGFEPVAFGNFIGVVSCPAAMPPPSARPTPSPR